MVDCNGRACGFTSKRNAQKRLTVRHRLFCAGTMLVLAACGDPGWKDTDQSEVAEELIGQTSSAITGGTLTSAAEFAGVVRIQVGNGSVCSGTKVQETATTSRFITAAHCQENPNQTTAIITNASDPGVGTTFTIASGGYQIHPSMRLAQNDLLVNPYDVASVTITNPTTSIPFIPLAAAGTTAVGTAVTLVGYGCDNSGETPEHDGKKQKADLTVGSQTAGNTAHYIRTSVGAIGSCEGDSGGALLTAAPRKLTGVLSDASSSSDFFSRTGNILDWLNNPLPPNASSLLADQSSLFLSNTGAKRGLCAAAASTASTSPIATLLNECDNPNGGVTGKPPGMRLQNSATGGGTFQILNRFSGFCLTVDPANPLAENAAVRFQTCVTSSTSDLAKGQAWSFGSVLTFSRDVKNKLSSKCLGTSNGSLQLNAALVQKTCGTSDAKWMLTK